MLNDAILAAGLGAKMRAELHKDVHLVHAALQSDRVIISLDCRAREEFARLGDQVRALKRLRWLDPAKEYDPTRAWLNAGK